MINRVGPAEKTRLGGFTRMINNMPGSTTTGRVSKPTMSPEPVFRIQPYGPATPGPSTGVPPSRTLVAPYYDALRRMFRQKGLPERFWR